MNSAGRLYKKSINKAFKKYQNDLIKKIRGLKSTNPKAYWDMIKDKKDNKTPPKSTWKCLKNILNKLNKCETKNKQNLTNECNNNNNEQINTDFTLLELKNAIKKLKTNRASGCDQIINEFLINANDMTLIIIL